MRESRRSRSSLYVVLPSTGLALAASPAWASRFASGFEVVLQIGALFALAGVSSLLALVLGRSRASLVGGSCLAMWAAREYVLAGRGGFGSATAGGVSLANLAALAVLLGYVAGWAVARWPGGQRRIAIAALVLTAAVLALWFVEPALALLALPVPVLLVPLAVGIGVRRAIEALGAARAVRRLAGSTLRGARAVVSYAGAQLASGKIAAAMRFAGQSRARRAWLLAVLAYLAGLLAATRPGWQGSALLRWAMEPGRVLHSMLSGNVQALPDLSVAWLVYGPIAAVLLGLASLALPVARARPETITSIETG